MRKATSGWRERARVSAAGPSFLRCPAASSTSGTETTSRLPRATQLVDARVHQRLGQLDEAEADRQLARRLAHVAGERPELLEPVGVAGAVADDHQGGRAACAWPRPRAMTLRARQPPPRGDEHRDRERGTIAAPTHASGDAAGASCSAGIRPS